MVLQISLWCSTNTNVHTVWEFPVHYDRTALAVIISRIGTACSSLKRVSFLTRVVKPSLKWRSYGEIEIGIFIIIPVNPSFFGTASPQLAAFTLHKAHGYLPFQPQTINTFWPVSNDTVWYGDRQIVYESNLPKVITWKWNGRRNGICKFSIASPKSSNHYTPRHWLPI